MTEPELEALLRKARMPIKETAAHIDDGRLLALHAGAVSDEERERIEEHLADCGWCRELLRELAAPVPDTLLGWAESAGPELPSTGARSWSWAVAGGGALAAAAAVLALVLVRPDSGSSLGGYTLEPLEGGQVQLRSVSGSERSAPPIFGLESVVEAVLRPEVAQDEPPSLAIYLENEKGVLSRLSDGYTELTARGGFIFEAPAASIFPRPGTYTLIFVLHRSKERLASTYSSLEALEKERSARFERRWVTYHGH